MLIALKFCFHAFIIIFEYFIDTIIFSIVEWKNQAQVAERETQL